jgi:hypothetical protein
MTGVLEDGRGERGEGRGGRGERPAGKRVSVPHPSPDQAGEGWGTRGGGVVGGGERSFASANDTPPYPTMRLSERMGHPVLWRSGDDLLHIWGQSGLFY